MQVGLKLCKYFHFQAACGGSINIYATEVLFCLFFVFLEFDFELLRVQPSWFTAPMSDTNPGAAILVHSLSVKSREGMAFSRTSKSQCVRYKPAAPTAKPLTFKCWFVTNPTTLNGLKNCCECICHPLPPTFWKDFWCSLLCLLSGAQSSVLFVLGCITPVSVDWYLQPYDKPTHNFLFVFFSGYCWITCHQIIVGVSYCNGVF